jgi:hypothetical protein
MRWGGMVDGMSRWEGLVHACSSMCAHVMHDGELWVGHGVCFGWQLQLAAGHRSYAVQRR